LGPLRESSELEILEVSFPHVGLRYDNPPHAASRHRRRSSPRTQILRHDPLPQHSPLCGALSSTPACSGLATLAADARR
jgi:hypothetical protein